MEARSQIVPAYLQRMWYPEIDLFASTLNNQTDKFMSGKSDPLAVVVDEMSETWAGTYVYAFPPLNMTGKVLQKKWNLNNALELWWSLIRLPKAGGLSFCICAQTPLCYFSVEKTSRP